MHMAGSVLVSGFPWPCWARPQGVGSGPFLIFPDFPYFSEYFFRLEQIGIAASKEYSIETLVKKMKEAWAPVEIQLLWRAQSVSFYFF